MRGRRIAASSRRSGRIIAYGGAEWETVLALRDRKTLCMCKSAPVVNPCLEEPTEPMGTSKNGFPPSFPAVNLSSAFTPRSTCTPKRCLLGQVSAGLVLQDPSDFLQTPVFAGNGQ